MAFSPRIVGEHRPDYHSLSSILKSPQFIGRTGEDLVLALYDFLTSIEDGTWHFWPVDELQGQPRIRRFTSDPIKLLTNYGWFICGQSACMMYGLYTAAGFKARQISVPGHLLCEVYYDDAWHILDVDMWTWFRNDRDGIASAFELASDAHRLIVENTNKSNPCNLPDRSLEDYAKMYADTKLDGDHVKNIFPHWSVKSHQLDFYLRPGEILRLSETAEGAYIFPQDWVDLLDKMNKEWNGYPCERQEYKRTYANGTWTYAPQLGSEFKDVDRGFWERSAVTQSPEGIVGEGRISFRLQSPYICAAKPMVSAGKLVYSDGASLRVQARGAITMNLILEEKTVQIAAMNGDSDLSIDLTGFMTCRYEAIIEFVLMAEAVLTHFSFQSPIMCAPRSLPKLVQGANQFQLKHGDDYKKKTVPHKQIIDYTPISDPTLSWVQAENTQIETWAQSWKCIAAKDSAQAVSVSYCFKAVEGKPFAWFHALCSVKEGPCGIAPKRAQLSWSKDGRAWREICANDLPNSHLQWDTSLEADVLLAQPLSEIYIRIVSETAITGMEFYGHLDMSAVPATQLEIQHEWREGEKTYVERISATTAAYAVNCSAAPQQHAFSIIGLSEKME